MSTFTGNDKFEQLYNPAMAAPVSPSRIPPAPPAALTTTTNSDTTDKTARVQNQINECVDIMQANINRVVQRGETMQVLQGKTEILSAESQKFQRSARTVRKKMWWQNMKMRLILIALALLVIAVIAIAATVSLKARKAEEAETANGTGNTSSTGNDVPLPERVTGRPPSSSVVRADPRTGGLNATSLAT
ncbi:hypothetical protein HK102_010116, partial [Quaeritorhiza haematococci]